MSETLFVSEIFDSLQGEGPSLGAPCTFLRLAGCNLTCQWCDTEYSWNWTKYDVRKETSTHGIAAIAQRVTACPRLVITGGEPLLQQRALEQLLPLLPAELPIEVETNGTIAPSPALFARINQWNVAPKLAHSGEPESRRLISLALTALRDTTRAWLKVVVETASDLAEVEALVTQLAWPRDRVYLMPQCRSADELARRTPEVVNWAIASRFRYTGRLHLQVWGGERGR